MTASPSQLTDLTRIRRGGAPVKETGRAIIPNRTGLSRLGGRPAGGGRARTPRVGRLLVRFPPIMHPEPIGRVPADGCFESAVDIGGDRFDAAGFAPLADGDLVAYFDAPAAQADPVTDAGVQRAII